LITDKELKVFKNFSLGFSMFAKLTCDVGEYVSILRSHGFNDEQIHKLVIQYLQVRTNKSFGE
jgi:hypothetical protein